MSDLPEETAAIKQEMIDHDEMSPGPSSTISSVLEVFKQELGTLKTERDCTITNLLISEPAGVAKYEIIPEEPNVTENAAPEQHSVVMSGGEIGFFRDENYQYCCTLCSYAYPTRRGLNRHHSRVHEEKRCKKMFSCSLCSFKGSTGVLYKHMKTIHVHETESLKTLGQQYSCSICNSKYDKLYKLARHKVGHSIKTDYECKHCSLFFSNVGHLENHASRHCQSELKKEDKCPHCDDKYFTKEMMRYHLIHSHKSLLSEKEIMANFHVCPVKDCKKYYAYPQSLYKHKKAHEPFRPCPHCGSYYQKMSQHIKRVHFNERIFSCSSCNFKGSARELRKHKNTDHVHVLKKFSCPFDGCKKTFRTPSLLKYHKNSHMGIRPFVCSHCDFSTNNVAYLRDHTERRHSEIAFGSGNCPNLILDCSYCDFSTNNVAYLRKHIERKHSESASGSGSTKTAKMNCSNLILNSKEATFPCKDCSESFTTELELDLHKLSVAHKQKLFGKNVKKTKSFQCDICSKQLATQDNLYKHKKTVHAHSCPFDGCKKTFRYPCLLKYHKNSHMGIRRFVCSHCDFSTNNVAWLRKHIERKHSEIASGSGSTKTAKMNCSNLILNSNEATFPCKDCSESFTTELELDLHKLSVAHKQNLFGKNVKKTKSFQCNICFRQLATQDNLYKHKETVEHVHSCPFDGCKKTFRYPCLLEFHTKRIHLKTISFQCDICSKQLATKYSLAHHKLTHSVKEKKELPCPECNSLLPSKQSLDSHMSLKHRHKESLFAENPVCKGCNEKFRNKKVLRNHMKYCVHIR